MNDRLEGIKATMTDSENLIVEMATRVFSDLSDPQTINNAADDGWMQPLWEALEESGLTLTWVPEESGGAGAGVVDGFEVLRAAGRYAVAAPLSETLLAGWLLGRAGLDCPLGPMTAAPVLVGDRIELSADGALSGVARRVPFAPAVDHIVAIADRDGARHVVLTAAKDCRIETGRSIAGDPQGAVDFAGVRPIASRDAGVTADDLQMMGAATRAAMIAGALEAALEISVEYAQQREAFGRAIGQFQAVQHNLSRLACEAAVAASASRSAADAIAAADGFDGDGMLLEVASAKIRCGEAAGQGAAIAHQAHGAIGFTREHVLHRFTQRLWAWRDEFGGESAWAVRLGETIARNGADELWPLVASR